MRVCTVSGGKKKYEVPWIWERGTSRRVMIFSGDGKVGERERIPG